MLYPLVEKLLIVDDPETTVVLLLLLLRILWLGRGVRLTVLRLVLPGEAWVPVQSGAEVLEKVPVMMLRAADLAEFR